MGVAGHAVAVIAVVLASLVPPMEGHGPSRQRRTLALADGGRSLLLPLLPARLTSRGLVMIGWERLIWLVSVLWPSLSIARGTDYPSAENLSLARSTGTGSSAHYGTLRMTSNQIRLDN